MVPPGEAAHRHRAVPDASGVWARAEVRAFTTGPPWLARTRVGDVNPGQSPGLKPATCENAAKAVRPLSCGPGCLL